MSSKYEIITLWVDFTSVDERGNKGPFLLYEWVGRGYKNTVRVRRL